jgi:hypothetical protein
LPIIAKATTVSSVKSKFETIKSVKREFQIDVAGPGIIANQMFQARTRKVVFATKLLPAETSFPHAPRRGAVESHRQK